MDKKGGKKILSSADIRKHGGLAGVGEHGPDIYVLGDNILSLPILRDNSKGLDTLCHFQIPNKTEWLMRGVSDCAPAAGIAMFLGALDWLLLGRFRWDGLVLDAMDDPA